MKRCTLVTGAQRSPARLCSHGIPRRHKRALPQFDAPPSSGACSAGWSGAVGGVAAPLPAATPPGPSATDADTDTVSIADETDAAVAAVAVQTGTDPATVRAKLEELQFLLPDLAPMARAVALSRRRWERVAGRIGQLQQWCQCDAAEREVLALVAAALKDGRHSSLQPERMAALVGAVSEWFAEVRASGQVQRGTQAELQRTLLQHCSALRSQLVQQISGQAAVALQAPQLMQGLLALRGALSGANVSRMVAAHPQLLLLEGAQLEARVAQAFALLKGLSVEEATSLIEGAPYLLQEGALEGALGEVQRAFPGEAPPYILLQHVRVGADGRLWRGKAPY